MWALRPRDRCAGAVRARAAGTVRALGRRPPGDDQHGHRGPAAILGDLACSAAQDLAPPTTGPSTRGAHAEGRAPPTARAELDALAEQTAARHRTGRHRRPVPAGSSPTPRRSSSAASRWPPCTRAPTSLAVPSHDGLCTIAGPRRLHSQRNDLTAPANPVGEGPSRHRPNSQQRHESSNVINKRRRLRVPPPFESGSHGDDLFPTARTRPRCYLGSYRGSSNQARPNPAQTCTRVPVPSTWSAGVGRTRGALARAALSDSGAGGSARQTFPQDVGVPGERAGARLLPPRGLGRTSRRTGDLAARTYPGPGPATITPFG